MKKILIVWSDDEVMDKGNGEIEAMYDGHKCVTVKDAATVNRLPEQLVIE